MGADFDRSCPQTVLGDVIKPKQFSFIFDYFHLHHFITNYQLITTLLPTVLRRPTANQHGATPDICPCGPSSPISHHGSKLRNLHGWKLQPSLPRWSCPV